MDNIGMWIGAGFCALVLSFSIAGGIILLMFLALWPLMLLERWLQRRGMGPYGVAFIVAPLVVIWIVVIVVAVRHYFF